MNDDAVLGKDVSAVLERLKESVGTGLSHT